MFFAGGVLRQPELLSNLLEGLIHSRYHKDGCIFQYSGCEASPTLLWEEAIMQQNGLGSGSGWDVLLVLPDAHQTEPVLQAMALANAWSAEYRLHVLFMSLGGPLIDAFQACSVKIWCPDEDCDPLDFAASSINSILNETSLAFAVTVSVTTRNALAYLKRKKVPRVALISEMASGCMPLTAVGETIMLSDQVVFPSKLVLEDALATDYMLSPGLNHHIIAPAAVNPKPRARLRSEGSAKMRSNLRPAELGSERFIVLGAGPINYLSGLDLFLEIACLVSIICPKLDVIFVWMDTGFGQSDPKFFDSISAQIKRFNLLGKMIVLEQGDNLYTALELADLFLVTERSINLPHICIEAMKAGLPIVHLDNGNRLSQTLQCRMSGPQVASCLTTWDAADRIVDHIRDCPENAIAALYNIVWARRACDPHAHAQKISRLAKNISDNYDEESQQILGYDAFDMDFFLPTNHSERNLNSATCSYLEKIRTGYNVRKPEPGFHPLKFSTSELCSSDAEPYVEFLRCGRPKGPWCAPVIFGGQKAPIGDVQQPQAKIALHIHAYYPDQVEDILCRLRMNCLKPDLYVSVRDAKSKNWVEKILEEYSGRVCAVEVVPNIGRDVGPLITYFGDTLVKNYEIVGHVHTKKSLHSHDTDMVNQWVHFLLSGVVGGPEAGPMVDRIATEFEADKMLGVVYPDDPHVFGWTSNRGHAEALARRMGLGPLPSAINFPAGSMFWMRSSVLRMFVDLDLNWNFYPVEPLPSDGTVLHALERLFGVVPELTGWKTAVTYTRGIGR